MNRSAMRRIEMERQQARTAASSSERALVTRLKHGDERAWEEFVTAYRRRLIGYFRMLGLHSDVSEDLAQESFTRIVRSIRGLVSHDRLCSWVFAIARNVAMEHMASDGTRRALSDGVDAVADTMDFTRAMKALAGLGPKDQDVLRLSCVAGLSGLEIAAVTRCSHAAVRVRLLRAKAKLRRAAEEKICGNPPKGVKNWPATPEDNP